MRNMYEAIVSGYLYHKRGHECSVDEVGHPNPSPIGGNDAFRRIEWAKNVKRFPFSAPHEPDLCDTLANTNLTEGVGICRVRDQRAEFHTNEMLYLSS